MHFENIYREKKGIGIRTKYSQKKDGTFTEMEEKDKITLSDYKLSTQPVNLKMYEKP